MALGSLFGGLALANAALGAVHGFAAPIGGRFPAPHGAVCAALLPHVMTGERAGARGSRRRQRPARSVRPGGAPADGRPQRLGGRRRGVGRAPARRSAGATACRLRHRPRRRRRPRVGRLAAPAACAATRSPSMPLSCATCCSRHSKTATEAQRSRRCALGRQTRAPGQHSPGDGREAAGKRGAWTHGDKSLLPHLTLVSARPRSTPAASPRRQASAYSRVCSGLSVALWLTSQPAPDLIVPARGSARPCGTPRRSLRA